MALTSARNQLAARAPARVRTEVENASSGARRVDGILSPARRCVVGGAHVHNHRGVCDNMRVCGLHYAASITRRDNCRRRDHVDNIVSSSVTGTIVKKHVTL